ncbi:unnamed protein product [Prorocentrum cordatum]|uniref:Integrase catalytic domain-containing protein n=1 Tax=Prorocentrum cordatum TaxID=2364126 RepID=A0ABN9XJ31_9DINO|nr:unnamed protein product [Polarella glacialis]
MFGWMMATRTVTYETEAETKVEAEAIDSRIWTQDWRSAARTRQTYGMTRETVVSEGAYLLLQELRGDAGNVYESISFERMDTNEAFDEIFGKLDVLYRSTQEVELLGRCDAFFGEFSRLPKETLNAYVLRHGQELSKLREAGLDLPDLLAGWHMMTKSAIPRWQILNLKALCNNQLAMQVVTESLNSMFGGDSTAHKKDIERGDSYWAEEEDDEVYWYEDDYTDELYHEDDVWQEEDEEPIPKELEDAYETTAEAFANYTQARAKMRELATARGTRRGRYQSISFQDESLLVARPCLEEWGMMIDYRIKKVMYLDEQPSEWIDLETNEKGHMIIDLLSFPSDVLAADEESSSTDADTVGDHKVESEKETDFFVTSSYGDAEIENAETTKFDAKQLEDWFAEANRTLDSNPKHGDFKTKKFTLETGWDFTNGSHRKAFMRELVKKRPEEVWIAPPCTVWSMINTLAEANKSNEYRQRRRKERAKQQREFLRFSREIYEAQQQAERHAHLEHPRYVASWETEAWDGMTGYDLRRMLGLIKKPTNVRTTKLQMYEGLWKTCNCKEKHVSLEGGHSMRCVENYTRKIAFQAAICIVDDPQNEASYAVEEMTQADLDKTEYKMVWKALPEKFTIEESVRVARIPRDRGFNDTVDIATCHVVWKGKYTMTFTIMDESSRFEVDTVVKDEKARTEIKALEKNWIHWAGAPAKIRAGQSGAHVSEEFMEWCDGRQIKLQLIPRDAHHRLGILERNHQVRREPIARYHEDHPEDSLKLAVRTTCGARNQLRSVKGSMPSQRALGRQPKNLGSLADEPTTTGDLGDHDEESCRNLARRRDAGKGESDLIFSYWNGLAMIAQFVDHTGEVIGQPEDYEGEHFTMEIDRQGVDTDGQVEATEADRQDEHHEGEQSDDGGRGRINRTEVAEMQVPTASEPPRPDISADASPDVGSPEVERETTAVGSGQEQVGVERTTNGTAAEKRKAEEQTAEDGDELLDAINAARRLNGLRPLPKRPKQTDVTTAASAASGSEGDGLLLLYEDADTVYLTNAAVKENVADAGKVCPMRFLLKWKMKDGVEEASARVTSTNVEKASPTLTQLTRFLILLILCQRAWKMVAADVKSAFLQCNQMITEAMLEIGFLEHALEKCCFLSYRLALDGDDPFLVWQADNNQHYVLDGVLGLHVDDFIGGGENFEREEDRYNKQAYEGTFLDRVQRLNQRVKFGKREFSNSIVFCGMGNTQSFSRDEIEVKAEAYIHEVKPISVEKTRRTHPDDPCTPKEISQPRGLNGAMQWPASQCMAQAAATISFAQGGVSKATVGSLLEANTSLSFLKLRLGVYRDASWATRPNGESQGGYMIFVIEDARIDDGQPTQLVIVDWASKKLMRICRSSLAGEAQSAANAVEALEFAKTMLTTMLFPTMQLTGTQMLQILGRRPCMTDCKALFDAANSQAATGGLTERRTGIEILQVNEKMRVRQQFLEKLRRMTQVLKYDATFTAGKKISQKERAQADREQDEAAADFDEANQAEDAEAEDGDEHEDQLREHVRTTIDGTRTAKKIAEIVAAAATKCAKGEKIEKVEPEANDERVTDNKKLVRTASTQSQWTYRRDLTTPRFQYLREFEQMASLSTDFVA